MNLSEIPTASALASRLTLVNNALAATISAANFVITTSGGPITIPLQSNEWVLGLQQLQSEIQQALANLGVNISS